jgi:uncharacterized protein YacL
MTNLQSTLHPAETAARQRAMIVRIIRFCFAVLVLTFTLLAVFRAISEGGQGNAGAGLWWIPVIAAAVLVVGVVGVDRLTPVKKISTITAVLVGIVLGLLATLAIGSVIDLLVQSWTPQSESLKALQPVVDSIKLVIGVSLSYLGIITVLQTQDDFRLVIPYVEFAKQIRGVRPLVLDTSALIDGRIVDVAATNFLQAPIIVPRFVVGELQLLADSGDSMKRTKGRRGLEMIAKLQRLGTVDVTIDETPVPGKGVDQMIIELARGMPGMVLTTDVALARIAAIQSVPVLNLNELSNATRMSLIPGEQVSVKLVREGEQAGQGVGYLADGTMVVAENGGHRINENVTMTVTSSLQTSAGRLIFARLEDAGSLASALSPVGAEDSEPPQLDDEQSQGVSSLNSASATALPGADPAPQRTPFPPKPPRSLKLGSPRNPRR